MSAIRMLRQLTCTGLIASLNVQVWKTKNSWRLDNSHRRGHRRDIPNLLAAADVRTVKTHRLG
jgi:hypothetical protein